MLELTCPSPGHGAVWIDAVIESAIKDYRAAQQVPDCWRKPLVGIADAADPLFAELKRVVAVDHALPTDLLPQVASVIVYFLPFQPFLGQENDQNGFYAARSWAQAYVSTNALIAAINLRLEQRLAEAGHAAVTTPATHNFDAERLISRWSHKHIAYIAGLGNFGHHQLIITQAGCCGRLGSLVTSMVLEPTPRPHEEWCLSRAGQGCHACVTKCRYGALHKTHFDRHACYRQLLRNDAHYQDLPLVDVCGKCGCGVPCSYSNPTP